jgi:hypothetical protein
LTEALSRVGIETKHLIDANQVQRKLDELPSPQAEFIECQIKRFLQSYGRRRNMPAGLERTRFILSRLTERPVYYIWFNPNLMLDTGYSILDENQAPKVRNHDEQHSINRSR